MMSVHSLESDWVMNEILLAQRLHKPIMPLLLAGEPFTALLGLQYEDVRGGQMPSESFGVVCRAQTDSDGRLYALVPYDIATARRLYFADSAGREFLTACAPAGSSRSSAR